ncbi:hypothetical protein [Actinomadura mexicana]|uniref:hypothetical protein n=1 Tax=Actinomadura mexicana TaxID=134959 RepID=UPI0015C65017|nr:hypothetical protein [Actinomadura mexicana]
MDISVDIRSIQPDTAMTWHDTGQKKIPEDFGPGCRSGHPFFDAFVTGREGPGR